MGTPILPGFGEKRKSLVRWRLQDQGSQAVNDDESQCLSTACAWRHSMLMSAKADHQRKGGGPCELTAWVVKE
jgi:hypothetical protein